MKSVPGAVATGFIAQQKPQVRLTPSLPLRVLTS